MDGREPVDEGREALVGVAVAVDVGELEALDGGEDVAGDVQGRRLIKR